MQRTILSLGAILALAGCGNDSQPNDVDSGQLSSDAAVVDSSVSTRDSGSDSDSGTTMAMLDGNVGDGSAGDAAALVDGGLSDGALVDGGLSDGALVDGGLSDGGLSDGGLSDGGLSDGGLSDGGLSDGGVMFDGGPSVMMDGAMLADGAVSLTPSAAGQIVITEIANSFVGDTDDGREWIELYNPSSNETYDLMGCTIDDEESAGNEPVMITESVVVGPGAYVVIGEASAEVTLDHPPLDLSELEGLLETGDGDAILLECPTAGGAMLTIDTLDWNEVPTMGAFPASRDGVTWQLSPAASSAIANDVGTNWCNTPDGISYGTTAGQLGTPGAANVVCPHLRDAGM